jgi:hypothetical protein
MVMGGYGLAMGTPCTDLDLVLLQVQWARQFVQSRMLKSQSLGIQTTLILGFASLVLMLALRLTPRETHLWWLGWLLVFASAVAAVFGMFRLRDGELLPPTRLKIEPADRMNSMNAHFDDLKNMAERQDGVVRVVQCCLLFAVCFLGAGLLLLGLGCWLKQV